MTCKNPLHDLDNTEIFRYDPKQRTKSVSCPSAMSGEFVTIDNFLFTDQKRESNKSYLAEMLIEKE